MSSDAFDSSLPLQFSGRARVASWVRARSFRVHVLFLTRSLFIYIQVPSAPRCLSQVLTRSLFIYMQVSLGPFPLIFGSSFFSFLFYVAICTSTDGRFNLFRTSFDSFFTSC